jgi:hypothetical protein
MSQFKARQMIGAEDAVSKTVEKVLEHNPNLKHNFLPQKSTKIFFSVPPTATLTRKILVKSATRSN